MSMYNYINFILLIFFIGRTYVSSFEVKDIYDINSIEKYIDETHNNVLSNNPFEKLTSSDNKKYNILKKIFDNMSNALEDLSAITNNSNKDYWPADLPLFLRKFDVDKMKHNYFTSTFLSSSTERINERRRMIEIHVKSLLEMAEENFFDTVSSFCSFVPKILLFINSDKRLLHFSIDEEYIRLVANMRVQINVSIMSSF